MVSYLLFERRIKMAGLKVEIPLRPCLVDDRRAMFHMWINYSKPEANGVHSLVLGLVEYDDGWVDTVKPEDIRFVDGGEFDEYIWE